MGRCERSSKSRYHDEESTSRHTHRHHEYKDSKEAPDNTTQVNIKASDIISNRGINVKDVAAKLGVRVEDIFAALGINVEDVAINNHSIVNSLNTIQFFIVGLNQEGNAANIIKESAAISATATGMDAGDPPLEAATNHEEA